jgi:chemotaxis protein CheX
MSQPSGTTPTTNLKLTQPFITATEDVFKNMLGVETVTENPYLKTSAKSTHTISGIVDFYGKTNGSVVVSFAEKGLDGLIEAFSGARPHKESAAFKDAIGELANMIAGSVKGRLGGVTKISTPRVQIGGQMVVEGGDTGPSLVVPFKCPYSVFTVEMYIKRDAAAAA